MAGTLKLHRGTSGIRLRQSRWLTFAALLLISAGFMIPLLWMVITSLKTQNDALKTPPAFIPTLAAQPTADRDHYSGFFTAQPHNFVAVLHHESFDFLRLARNTLIVAILTVIGTTFSSACVAYGFAKINFRGRNVLFALMLSTMMIPFPVTMVSLFTIFRYLGDFTGIQFLGTLKPLWLPAFFGSAFNIFLLRQFFLTIPEELSEAARIDGCSEVGIFLRIILPLARPALSVVALFAFMWAWNDFLGPLVYIQDMDHFTLALGLQAFQGQHNGTNWALLMAAALLVIAPVVILFFLIQRSFIEGIATTGIKG